ncbi:tRNA lysidine(34) synthetase TilS [Methylocystis heyeri]|uniref:tRNA(Ile)-lysidine synthase n=1 Tax=Methylocystis heyeri TaxID=391905 RepID=A0A6B8KH67_9HYPH|nr:tRNA lysidine(34) synthetase TilS [Methylocystis heyeri]QGM46949.1 tRNA lysidine(34) synthetase TilS [Methylocystis heyeri]
MLEHELLLRLSQSGAISHHPEDCARPQGPPDRAAPAPDLLASLAGEGSLLLAVSGGPDSVALMLLAAQWSRTRPDARIEVATVDHGLRQNAHDEALLVGRWARAQGFVHHILTWEGPKPAARIQERAREARYDLLCACAKEIGPECAIVTAHHADDQAETILFRLLRGSGVSGLAGMAASSQRAGVRLLRPLLGASKAELENICVAAGHAFVRDPSNENEKFARAKLRKMSATLEEQGLHAVALRRLGRRAAQADEALNWCAERAWPAAVLVIEGTQTRFDPAALREAPAEIVQRLLLMDFRRREGRIPRLDRLERAAETVKEKLKTETNARIALGSLLIEIGKDAVTLRPAPPRFRGFAKFETKSRRSADNV